MVLKKPKIPQVKKYNNAMEGEYGGLSSRMTNAEIVRCMRDQKISQDEQRDKEMQLMRKEMETLKEELHNKSSEKYKEVRQDSDEDPLDQRLLVRTLKSMERRTMDAKINFTYNGKMDPEAIMDQVDAITNFFDCEGIPKNQRVKIAKSRLKGFALRW